jgi:2-dehydro-3-deoxyphosphogalactonate aldolase
MNKFETAFEQCALVAILRGIKPSEAQEIGKVLYQAGFRIIEVPLNSPDPLKSIKILAESLPQDCIVGAGTVLTTDDVHAVKQAGGSIIIMPHSDPDVVKEAKAQGMFCMPGVATPTEGFAAFKNGADGIKLFPAEMIPPSIVKAWRAVFKKDLKLIPVGGISVNNMSAYLLSGASGFGLGGSLYNPNMSVEQIKLAGESFIAEFIKIKNS